MIQTRKSTEVEERQSTISVDWKLIDLISIEIDIA